MMKKQGSVLTLLLIVALNIFPTVWAQEKTLVIAMNSTPKGVDPDIWVPGQIEATVNLYEGLTSYGTRVGSNGKLEVDPGKIQPHLAESWTVSPDGKKYLFKLKHGIRSPFGNELTAQDIVWTYEKSALQKRTGQFMASVGRIEKVEAASKYEVRFQLSDANRIFLGALTLHLPAIFDSVEAKKHATPDDPYATKWLSLNSAGFGPYHLQSLQSGQQAVFVVNPNYFFKKPYYSKIIWREVPSPATRVALVRTGQVQYAEQIPFQQLTVLRTDPAVKVESVPGFGGATVRMNPRYPPFDKVKVRQAVAYATDYAAMVRLCF